MTASDGAVVESWLSTGDRPGSIPGRSNNLFYSDDIYNGGGTYGKFSVSSRYAVKSARDTSRFVPGRKREQRALLLVWLG